MKLHDPDTERELIRIAARARGGKPMARPDPPHLLSRMTGVLAGLAFAGALTVLAFQVFPSGDAGRHWQRLICCVLLSGVALTGSTLLFAPLNARQGYAAAMFLLPIRGERILAWVRHRFFIKTALLVALVCGVCALSLRGFSHPGPTVATAILLMAMTFATFILLDERPFQSPRRVGWILVILTILWLIGLLVVPAWKSLLNDTPDGVVRFLSLATWICPFSWCLPGRFESGGAWLALPWIVCGAWRWRSWPRRTGPLLDRPRDLMMGAGEDDEEDERFPIPSETDLDEVPEAPGDAGNPVALAKPMELGGGGWVDRWIRRVIGPGDAVLAAAVMDLGAGWTKRTNRLILGFLPGCGGIWAFLRFWPEGGFKETSTGWLQLVSLLLPALILLPGSNAIPRATAGFAIGNQGLPVFAMLPVGVRDLLRISGKITRARSGVAVLVGTPMYAALFAILGLDLPPVSACWLVPAGCCFWLSSRPLFIWYRLQIWSWPRRGVRLVHAGAVLLQVALAMLWLVAGLAGIVCGLLAFSDRSTPDERFFFAAWAAGGLLASALGARLVFEIHRVRLRWRQFDWLASE